MFITVQYLKRLYGTIFMSIFMGSVYIIKADIYPFHNFTIVILKLFIAEAFQTECMNLLLFVVQSVSWTSLKPVHPAFQVIVQHILRTVVAPRNTWFELFVLFLVVKWWTL